MLDEESLLADLRSLGLDEWQQSLLPEIRNRLQDGAHGHLERWKEILDALRDADNARQLLLELAPWRKGPFVIGDIRIDAEWRSDLKWRRLVDHIEPLAYRNVLDVGSGNGWYAMQMRAAGARLVIGVDPTLLFVVQFEAVRRLTGAAGIHILPIGLEALPPASRAFDTTFSMGVLYHRRDPAAHLDALHQTLKPGGQLVLETLIFPGDDHTVHVPEGRYARMRNVRHLPTVPALLGWVRDAGFSNVSLVDRTTTTTDEQRATEWMPYESLAEALDPTDSARTIEGLPAPVRAIVTATAG